MANSLPIITQWLVGIFSLGMMYYSFRALNNCDRTTDFLVRIPLTLFLPSGLYAFIAAISGATIHWSYALIVVGITIHLAADRRHPKRSIQVKLKPQSPHKA